MSGCVQSAKECDVQGKLYAWNGSMSRLAELGKEVIPVKVPRPASQGIARESPVTVPCSVFAIRVAATLPATTAPALMSMLRTLMMSAARILAP